MSTEVSWTDVPGVPGPTAFGMTKNELRIDGRNPTKWIGESLRLFYQRRALNMVQNWRLISET